MLRSLMAWLGTWDTPNGGVNDTTQYVPADNAYGYYPVAVPVNYTEKADFSKAPQLRWWMEDKKDACKHGRAHRQNRC